MSEMRWRRLMEQSPLSTQIFAPDGVCIAVNPAWEKLWGVTLADYPGYNIRKDEQLVARGIMPLIERAFAGESVNIEPIPYVTDRGSHAGEPRWAGAYMYPVKDDAGRVEEVVLIHHDVTETKLAQDSLARTTERLDLAQSAAHIGVFDWHIPSGNVVWTDEEERLFGLPPGTFDGRIESWSERVVPDDLPRMQREMSEAMARREPQMEFSFRIQRSDGQVRWIEGSSRFIYDETGRPLRMVGVNYDATEQRRAQTALREAEQRYRAVFEASRDGKIIYTLDGTIVEANPAACEMYGYTRDELIGVHAPDAMHPDAVPMFRDFLRVCGEGGEFHCETTDRRRDGSSFPIEVHGTSFALDGTVHLMAVIRDITQRRGMEAALRESEERLRLGLRAGQTGTWDWDIRANRVMWSEQLYEMHGLGRDEFGGTVEAFGKLVHPDDSDRVSTVLQEALASGESYEIDFRTVRPDGESRWLSTTGKVYFDDTGQPIRMLGATIDISDRKRAEEELRAAKEAAERASDAKSEFLATLSHELRTPLTPVLLTVSLLESHPSLPADLRDDVKTIRRNVELESRLISDLLDLTRITRGKLHLDMQDVDLHLLVRSAIDICQREASAKLNVELRASRHLVRGDSTRVQQIFWNLISNAIKFTGRDGQITVRSVDAPDGRVRVEVSDNGEGIDPAVLPRLFTAFEQGDVRMMRKHAGLGLGLAISKRLVDAHGGTITALSEGRGHGATFVVELPTVMHSFVPTAIEPTAPARNDADGRPLSVLLVEDHEPTLVVMSKLLRLLGHRVSTASTAASATASAQRDNFDVIISDLGLPDGSGLDVMTALRDRYAGRAIALTGYGMESDIAASKNAGFAEHLTKPVDLPILRAAIARVVDGHGAQH